MTNTEHLTRQLDLIPLSILGTPITIIGCGAIGGWTTLSLAKTGFGNLTVIDFDTVDTVNLNSQFFRFKDVGQPKAIALQNLVEDFTGIRIQAKVEKYEAGIFPGIVIAAVDSMAVRRAIWESHANKAFATRAIIDPRMGAETAALYVTKPTDLQDRKTYPKSLYSDRDAVQEPCTRKATAYTASLISGLVVKAVKDLLTRPDYLRSAQWDIAANELVCFPRAS